MNLCDLRQLIIMGIMGEMGVRDWGWVWVLMGGCLGVGVFAIILVWFDLKKEWKLSVASG